MNKYLFLLVFLSATISCETLEQKPGESAFSADDQKEILEVLNTESDAFYARDFETWRQQYDPNQTSWTCVEENGLLLEAYSKKELDQLVGDFMKDFPAADTVLIKRENILFIPGPQQVWVNFDEFQTSRNGIRMLKGIRLMTRQDGAWKISAMHSSFVKKAE